jgi:hypothetical protein
MRARHASSLLLVLTACTAEKTELIVAIDTDLDVPGQIDAVRVDVVGPTGQVRRANGPLVGIEDLPASVGVVYTDGPLGPIQLTVTGLLGSRDLIQRRARTSFVEGQTRVLWLTLFEHCLERSCPLEETCGEQGCRPIEVEEHELTAYNGGLPRRDGGMLDGGFDASAPPDACVPVDEICNERDDDCDREIDETFDLMTDVEHCGGCDVECPKTPSHGSPMCRLGDCALNCDERYADCDTDVSNGCEALVGTAAACGNCITMCTEIEAPLCEVETCVSMCAPSLAACGTSCVDVATDPNHCGECDHVCPEASHAAAACAGEACGFVCDPGAFDCDLIASNGCESEHRELVHCGACGRTCALPNASESCASGSCEVVACERSFRDCDELPSNGCETDVNFSTAHCGRCGAPCPPDPPRGHYRCSAGRCVLECDPGFGNCDSNAENGCEADLGAPATCGGCSVRCEGATPLCVTDAGGARCVVACEAPTMRCGSSCVDVTSDPSHCGDCTNVCVDRPRATALCRMSECALGCGDGYLDCDTSMENGCETPITTNTDCGACRTPCAPNHAAGTCATGVCLIASCGSGYDDCNESPLDGCETPLDTATDCGGCDRPCVASGPQATGALCLSTGTCRLTCTPGYGDCDLEPSTGCEQSLTTLTNCGNCGVPCALAHAEASCASGTCRVAGCEPNYRDCDLEDGTGCEADTLTDRNNCGECGMRCEASEECCGGTCLSAPCP